jgi:hypothetical protein
MNRSADLKYQVPIVGPSASILEARAPIATAVRGAVGSTWLNNVTIALVV